MASSLPIRPPLTDSRVPVSPILPPRIALIGFMGSGKTTTGRTLAGRLGYRLLDTDALILQSAPAGKSIPDLFAAEGEARFRDLEADAVALACAASMVVIATGGGVPLRQDNVDKLRESAFVVWLAVRPDVVVERTRADAASRPLLSTAAASADPGALHAHVLAMIAQRGPHYQSSAHCIVDSSDRPPYAIAAEIARKAEQWHRGSRSGQGPTRP